MPRDKYPISSHTGILFRLMTEIAQGNSTRVTREEVFEQLGRERAVEWMQEKFGWSWPSSLDDVERAGLNRAMASQANVIDVERKWMRGDNAICVLACFFIEFCQNPELVDTWIAAVQREMDEGKFQRQDWS